MQAFVLRNIAKYLAYVSTAKNIQFLARKKSESGWCLVWTAGASEMKVIEVRLAWFYFSSTLPTAQQLTLVSMRNIEKRRKRKKKKRFCASQKFCAEEP